MEKAQSKNTGLHRPEYRLHYITDVNKPGHYPHGGWWYVVKGVYTIVTGKRHNRREDAQAELETLPRRDLMATGA